MTEWGSQLRGILPVQGSLTGLPDKGTHKYLTTQGNEANVKVKKKERKARHEKRRLSQATVTRVVFVIVCLLIHYSFIIKVPFSIGALLYSFVSD